MSELAQRVFARTEPDLQLSLDKWHAEQARLLGLRRKLNRDIAITRQMIRGLRAQRKKQVRT
jgi:hypothetical protein